MAKRHRGVESVDVASSVAFPLEVAGLFQLRHDALCRALRDPDLSRDIPQPYVGVLGYAQQNVRVIGEERP